MLFICEVCDKKFKPRNGSAKPRFCSRDCYNTERRKQHVNGQVNGVKLCHNCNQSKDLDEFPRNKSTRDGRSSRCNECNREYSRNYPGKKESNLKHRLKKYDLTTDEYRQMQEIQNYKCAICKKNKDLVVDHDHLKGNVRSLLCSSCNTSLGLAGEDIEILSSMIQYILLWKTNQ